MRLTKLISKTKFFKRKTLLIYFSALVLPLIVVAYLGFDTLAERQKSTKNILDSNLWIAGESALNQLERELNGIEANILNIENFRQISSETIPGGNLYENGTDANRYNFSLFLLDESFFIIYPIAGAGIDDGFKYTKSTSLEFEQAFRQAEFHEFQERNYSKAFEGYRKCFESASSEQDKAYAIEGLGRVSMTQKKYNAAGTYYHQLHTNYSRMLNSAGHPYGIIGLLQLLEINKLLVSEDDLQPEFLDTYGKLKNGYWKLPVSSYRFFISEIETILESDFLENPLQPAYYSLKNIPSSYLMDLEFVDNLRADIIPKIRESQILTTSENDPQIRRIIGNVNGKWSLVSFRKLMNFQDGQNFTGGLLWDTEKLKENMIPLILHRISTDSGLDLFISEDETSVSSKDFISENSLSLSFRNFPFPWKLNVVQTAMIDIEKESRKEMIIYGLFLGMLFILMTLGAILIARDIRREAESMNMKTEFVHNVSHELKTPLSLIRLYGETLLIKQNLTDNDKTDALQVITKESERLSHMISNILDFSKIEMGRKEFNFQKGDFTKTIQDTLDSYRYHFEKEGFKITEEIDRDIPMIYFDKEAVEGLLINLLSNAIKYSQDIKDLTVRLYRENEDIILQVSDKGVGIAPVDQLHIFERFYRTKQKPGYESRGSGLGLTLVKHIVESHEGSIDVSSEPGEGSTFSIKFPVRRSPHKAKE